jgi:hypothetical protein
MASVGDIYEIRICCTWGVQTAINVRHYRVQSIRGTGPLDTEVAANIDALVAPAYKSLLTTQTTYRGVSAQKVWPLPPQLPAFTLANLGAGNVTGEALPGQLAGLIRLKTDFAGPRYRGRLYFPFPSELASETTGIPTAAYVTGLQLLANDLNLVRDIGNATNGGIFVPTIWSKKFKTTADVRYVSVPQRWATMRSRGNFGDPNAPPF